jgi:hypothetical protein
MSTEEVTTTDAVESNEEVSADPDTLDPTQISYTLTIDGQEREVTLDELIKGNMRQADYTRKTQAVARMKQEAEEALQLRQALHANPARTLQALAESFGVETLDTDVFGNDDPRDKQIAELERRLEATEQVNRNTAVDREVAQLKAKFGIEDADVVEVMQHAVQTGLPSLEAAFKDIHFDDFYDTAKKLSGKKAQEQLIVKAKKAASVVTSGGGSAGGTVEVVERKPGQKLTLEEAYQLAKEGKQVAPWRP